MSETKRAVARSFDEHVAGKLRRARAMQGYTQVQLAEAVGVSFQQIQKYENGSVRVSAGRLMQFCKVLEIPLAFFYPDIIAQPSGDLGGVIVDLTGLTSAKASAVRRLVKASESDAETIGALLARLQKTYGG